MERIIELHPTVVIGDGCVSIDGFIESDPTVFGIVGGASDPEAGVRSCLVVGARALEMSTTTVDELAVGRAFDQMVASLGGSLDQAVSQIADLTDSEVGPVAILLGDVRAGFEAGLSGLFDPDSKSSALGLLESVFAEAVMRQDRNLRATLNPDDAESPLGRWRTEMLRAMTEAVGSVQKEVRELAEGLAVRQARAEVEVKGTAKGFRFEDLVHLAVSEVSCLQGDEADAVGALSGATGAKVGDTVVTLNREFTGGRDSRFVVEMKNRRVGLRKVLEELDRAMANRDAQAAIAVFASSDQAPVPVSFAPFDNKAIVVMDGEERPNMQTLRLACLWARWVAVRDLAFETDTLDAARIEHLIEEARLALRRVTTIRRCHSTARKGIEQASAELNALVDETEQVLGRLQSEMRLN